MEPLAISWLVTSSSSPLIAVLGLWTIYVFHTYRRRWRTVDLFLLTICCLELVISIFTFCYSIISLIIPPFHAPCNFTQWGLISCRTFQIATLTSMVVDRALTVRWPYRYRFSVRRNQIRYHIGVLSLVSVLVGVAAVFARVDIVDNKNCYLHPAQWDVRYIIFLLSLYGVLIMVTFICMIQVEIHRSRHGLKISENGSFQLPECASPDLPSATGMNSPLDTQSSTGSTRALHRPSRQASRRPYGKNNKTTSDLRWPSVALTTLLCFSVNHIPHLVLMSMAVYYPYLWSPWHEAIIAWLGLLEGIIVPLLLFCKDHALRGGLRRAFQRRSGALSPLVGDDGPFQMYFDKDHFRKRGTFGSVTPIGIITNYRRTPGKKRRTRKNSGKYTLPGLHNGDSVLAKSCLSDGFLGNEPLSKLSCADLTSLEMWREEDEENFYATLSDDFSTFSCKSADDSALSEDLRISEELYGGSFTTVANDDFEFHDTRPCGGEVRMKPALSTTPPSNNSFKGGFSRNVSFKDDVRKKELARMFQPPLQDIFNHPTKKDIESECKDSLVYILPPPEWKNKDNTNLLGSSDSDHTPPRKMNNKIGNIANQKKTTSYSMNDLDLIHKKSGCGNDVEATFVLPVKSESTMSLYRLNVERDLDQMAMTPSRSENNVNGDSGFGSGAQSTNPVWSGFLCRKPSDPFWNIRKPTTHASAAGTPTRNYPGLLHPRMRKIPWISAWKKLDENSSRNERNQVQDISKGDSILDWKDNMVYEGNVTGDVTKTRVGTIDEELSDVGTPVCNFDYNLNIFAKESGVLLENAYGKIVRDDCGVQVNFYGKSVQSDGKDTVNGNININKFDEKNVSHNNQIYQQNKDCQTKHTVVENSSKNDSNFIGNDYLITKPEITENINNQFVCEPRLNGGHYENLFGTKENIFAQCDDYLGKNKINFPEANNGLMKRNDDNVKLRKDDSNLNCNDTEPSYGQVKKVERKESANRKYGLKKPQIKLQEIHRKDSSNKNGIKRRESRSRSDSRANNESNNPANFNFLDNMSGDINKKPGQDEKIEIEMKNVPLKKDLTTDTKFLKTDHTIESPRIFHRQGSQSRKPVRNSNDPRRWKFEHSNIKKQNSNEQRQPNFKLIRRESLNNGKEISNPCGVEQLDGHKPKENGEQMMDEVGSRIKSNCNNAERRNNTQQVTNYPDMQSSELKDNDKLVKSPYNRNDNLRSRISRRDSCSKRSDDKSDGLWASAIPFPSQTRDDDKDEENGNFPKKESRIESHPLRRSPRKSNLPRRESKNRNEKPSAQVRRKSSGNRRRNEKDLQGSSDYQISKKDTPSKLAKDSEEKKTLLQQGDAKFDDFFKYRDKCEDNFSRIQNLNRETSAERESTRLDQLLYRRKMNGNLAPTVDEAYPFETYQENGKLHFHSNSKAEYDNNENCKQKKLAITDFL